MALAGSASWGVADFLAGSKSRALPLLTVIAVSQWIGLVAFAAGFALSASSPSSGGFVPWSIAAGIVALIGLAALYRGMAVGLISVISPITAAGSIIPVAVGLARGEVITTMQAVGIALAILGVALVSRPTGSTGGGRLAAGVGFALVSAASLGIFLTVLGIASETDPVWSTFVQRCTTSALVTAVVVFTRPALALARPDLGVLAAIGLLDAGATLLFAAAAALGSLGTSAVLASLYPVVPLLLAQTLLRERISTLHWIGVVVVLTGACMITAFG
jgi:drug/metabolite transporter (DMT)-like permease